MKRTVNKVIKKFDRPLYVTEIMEDSEIPAKEKWKHIVKAGLEAGAYGTDIRLNAVEHVFPTDTREEAQRKIDLIEENIEMIKNAASSQELLDKFMYVSSGEIKEKAQKRIDDLIVWLGAKLAYRDSSENIYDKHGRFRYQRAEEIIREEWKDEYTRAAGIKAGKKEEAGLKRR